MYMDDGGTGFNGFNCTIRDFGWCDGAVRALGHFRIITSYSAGDDDILSHSTSLAQSG
ncbi:hypothetical protein GCM10010869_59210 [Mesorhizobium tianshanense]|nr:hypothetical protein GCM10010869_59210 [Mesorhizobium tianshanense]